MLVRRSVVAASLGAGLLAWVMLTSTAGANVIFTGTGTLGGNSVSASADFSISGSTLTITLTNTSSANVPPPPGTQEAPTNTLSGLSFLLAGGDSLLLVPVSASSPNAIFDSADCTTPATCTTTPVNVGGEWGYQTGFSGAYAVGSAGYITTGLPGDLGNFNGVDLDGQPSLNGIDFAVISNTVGALNGGLTGRPLIQNQVILTLTGVSGLSELQIGTVSFLYGTQAGEGTIVGGCTGNNCGDVGRAPEPGSLALVGLALSGLALARRRWKA